MSLSLEQFAAILTRNPALAHVNPQHHFRRADTPEKVLLSQVLSLATRTGWLTYHTHDSRRSAPGFPDLCLLRPGELIFAELKRSATAKPTLEQHRWLSMLETICGPSVEVYLWTPADWAAIDARLTAPGKHKKGGKPHQQR